MTTATETLSFDVSKADADKIIQIAERACRLAIARKHKLNLFDLMMDLTAVHANGNPLKLLDLLHADEFNFIHDVWGIMRHIDRSTGKLRDCFSPRFSQKR